MNFLKTPQQMLMEEAGMSPASPGMLKTPQQMLMEQSGIQPQFFADGGSTNTNPQDMLAELIALGYEPQRFNNGGGVMGTEYVPYYNPDAVMQAIPNESLYSRAHGALSNVSPLMARILLGDARMGETGMEAPIADTLVNPLLWGIGTADSARGTYEAAKANDPIGYGLGLAETLFNASPFLAAAKKLKAPAKKAVSAISKKTKE